MQIHQYESAFIAEYATVLDLWVMAAKHEIEMRESMSNARALLQQAIRVNTSTQQLWVEVGFDSAFYRHISVPSRRFI